MTSLRVQSESRGRTLAGQHLVDTAVLVVQAASDAFDAGRMFCTTDVPCMSCGALPGMLCASVSRVAARDHVAHSNARRQIMRLMENLSLRTPEEVHARREWFRGVAAQTLLGQLAGIAAKHHALLVPCATCPSDFGEPCVVSTTNQWNLTPVRADRRVFGAPANSSPRRLLTRMHFTREECLNGYLDALDECAVDSNFAGAQVLRW